MLNWLLLNRVGPVNTQFNSCPTSIPSPDPPMNIRLHIYPLAPRLGDLVRLTCTAASLPESSFIWMKVEEGEDRVVMDRSGVMVSNVMTL